LSAAKFGGPGGEAFHPGALAPHEMQELARVEVICFGAEESLHAPLQVRTTPGTQAVTLGDHPVIAQRVEHPASVKPNRVDAKMRAGNTAHSEIRVQALPTRTRYVGRCGLRERKILARRRYLAAVIDFTVMVSPVSVPVTSTLAPANASGDFWSLN